MKKIVIIGGSAAGPKCAAKAKRLNQENEIEMYTNENVISYSACGLPYYIEGIVDDIDKLLIRKPEEFEKQGVKVFLNHHASKIIPDKNTVIINEKEVLYDELIICTGATAFVPDSIKNAQIEGVYTLRRVQDGINIKNKMEQSKSVAIIGAGFIAIELIEAFVKNGIKVHLIESTSRLMRILDCEFSEMIMQHILENSSDLVDMHFNREVDKLHQNEDGHFYKLSTKCGLEIEADFCIIATGVRPNVTLAQEAGVKIGKTGAISVDKTMKTNYNNIWAAGDCVESNCLLTNRPIYMSLGNIANKQGRVAAINATLSPEVHENFDGILGSAITKYFNYKIATSGMTFETAVQIAQRFNLDPISTTITKKDKAGYMPESNPVTIKLVADKKTGRFLGAQCVGTGDVNKTISTMTSALQSKLTVEQFLHMDLPYAPPMSSTIDALLTAGYKLNSQIKEIQI